MEGAKRPKKKTIGIPSQISGAAGVYYVAFELSRLGYIALPTNRNVRGFDIIVSDQTGLKHASIQVKTLQNRQRFWPCSVLAPYMRNARNCFYIFVRFDKKQSGCECFVATAKEVANNMGDYSGPFSGFNLKQDEEKKYLNRWDKLRLD